MASLNRVTIMGRLGRDPESRSTPGGQQVVNFSMATTEVWKDRETGERKESTEWHRLVAFGPKARVVDEYLSSGSPVYVEGKLRTRKWTDQDGTDRYTTEIVVDEIKLLEGREAAEERQSRREAEEQG